MVDKEKKEKQMRLTLQDTLHFQNVFRELLKKLINENRPLTHVEKTKFFVMLPKALLSQGATESVYFVKENGWFIFSSVQNLALRISDLYTDKVCLNTSRPEKIEVTISIGELWQFLYDKVLYLFPQACGEALHISAENLERPHQGAYEFSSKEGLS